MANGTGGSHVWRRLTMIKEEGEHIIWWQTKSGETSFWLDNWTKQEACII